MLVLSFTITGKLNIELAALINSIIYLYSVEGVSKSLAKIWRIRTAEKRVNLTTFIVHRRNIIVTFMVCLNILT